MSVTTLLTNIILDNDTRERCGLLLEGERLLEIPNIANDPVTGYYMDPEKVLPHLTSGTIAGTWHTHPDSLPVLSSDDMEGFLAWPHLRHYIIGREKGKTKVKCYRVDRGAVVECD